MSTIHVAGGLLTVVYGLAAMAAPVLAQPDTAPTFKQGDQVEVQDGFDWKKATVVDVNRTTGWIDVLFDEVDLPKSVPEAVREQFRRRSLPARRVRAINVPTATAASVPRPIRTWTDSTGKFSIEARFDGVSGTSVALVRSDGTRIEVPLAGLSEQDASYVRDIMDSPDNPFKTARATAPIEKAKKANWREVRILRPQTFKRWTYSPPVNDAQDVLRLADLPDVSLPLANIPGSDAFFEKVLGLYISDDDNRAVVCREEGQVGGDEQHHLELIDLVKGRSGGLVPLPASTAMLDIWPDGDLVMYRPDVFGFGKKTILTVAHMDAGRLTPLFQWEPYAQEDWEPRRDIDSAWFLSSDRVLTINHQGKALTVWDIASAKALSSIPVRSFINLKTALSPDRKLLGVVMDDGIAIIDLVTPRHVATIPVAGRDCSGIVFRGDPGHLAAISRSGVTVWDLANGEVIRELDHPLATARSSIGWAGDFLFLQNRYLFDLERRVLLWEYRNVPTSSTAAKLHHGRLWAVLRPNGTDAAALTSTAFPHREAMETADRLPSADDLLVVKPGDEVAIELDVDPGIAQADEIRQWFSGRMQTDAQPEDERSNILMINAGGQEEELIRRSLTDALEAAGLRVVEKSNLVVKAICKRQPSQTIDVNVDGRWPVRQQDIVRRTVTPHASYLEMSLDGKPLWKRGFIAQPGHIIFVEPGETLDAALERLTRPNLSVFKNAKFSGYVARPGAATENGAYGVSQLTADGLIGGQSSRSGERSF